MLYLPSGWGALITRALILPCVAFSFTHQSHHLQLRHGQHIMLHACMMLLWKQRSVGQWLGVSVGSSVLFPNIIDYCRCKSFFFGMTVYRIAWKSHWEVFKVCLDCQLACLYDCVTEIVYGIACSINHFTIRNQCSTKYVSISKQCFCSGARKVLRIPVILITLFTWFTEVVGFHKFGDNFTNNFHAEI